MSAYFLSDKSVRPTSGFEDALGAAGVGAGVGDAVVLAIERDDEHGASVEVAAGLVGHNVRGAVATGHGVADTFAEAASAEFLGAAEEIDGEVGTVGRDAGFHGAEMFVTEGEQVRPHGLREFSRRNRGIGSSGDRVKRTIQGQLVFAINSRG